MLTNTYMQLQVVGIYTQCNVVCVCPHVCVCACTCVCVCVCVCVVYIHTAIVCGWVGALASKERELQTAHVHTHRGETINLETCMEGIHMSCFRLICLHQCNILVCTSICKTWQWWSECTGFSFKEFVGKL